MSRALPTSSGPRDGLARAGFICGLVSFIAALLAALLAGNYVPGGSSGEGVLLFIFVVLPLGLVGLVLSLFGRRSARRHGLASAGTIFATIALLGVCLAAVIIYASWSYCFTHSCM